MSQPTAPSDKTATAPLPSGNDPALLPQVRGWNWGAFFLTWLWAFAHRLPRRLALACLVISIMPVIAAFTLAFAIYFGRRGNELAWRYRKFDSLEQFRATEDAWRRWALRVVVGVVATAAVAWPAIHAPLKEHRDCARCHLKRTRHLLQSRPPNRARPARGRGPRGR